MLRLLAICLAAVLLVGCQSPATPAPATALDAPWPEAPERPRLRHRAQFPPGERIFMNHRGVIVRIQDPDLHMKFARRAFVRGRATLAATEVEKVRAGVLWFGNRAAGDRRKQLHESARNLRMLERKLRRREIDTVRALDVAFSEALDALEGRKATAPISP